MAIPEMQVPQALPVADEVLPQALPVVDVPQKQYYPVERHRPKQDPSVLYIFLLWICVCLTALTYCVVKTELRIWDMENYMEEYNEAMQDAFRSMKIP